MASLKKKLPPEDVIREDSGPPITEVKDQPKKDETSQTSTPEFTKTPRPFKAPNRRGFKKR